MSTSFFLEEKLKGGSFGFDMMQYTVVKSNSAQSRRVYRRLLQGEYNERKALLTLHHPLIVQMDHDLSIEAGFVCQHHYSNGDLKNFARQLRRALYEDELWFVFTQLLEALLYIHRRGIVHADLKPSNVLITYYGSLRLTDFSKSAVGLAENEERKYHRVGCFSSHLPPEAFPLKSFSYSFDFFSLGSSLSYLASPSGRYPFPRQRSMQCEEALAVFKNPPDIAPLLPPNLRELVEPMLKICRFQRLGRATDVFCHPAFVRRFGSDVQALRLAFINARFPNFSRCLLVVRGSECQ